MSTEAYAIEWSEVERFRGANGELLVNKHRAATACRNSVKLLYKHIKNGMNTAEVTVIVYHAQSAGGFHVENITDIIHREVYK
jgi:hypothetical protein